MKNLVQHKTVRIKKKLKAPVSQVYAAFASVKARSKWSVPKGDAIKYSQSAFKIGGKDVFRCGLPGSLEFKGVVHYHEILKYKRILSTEILSHSGKIISVALLTTEFIEEKGSTSVVITAQVSSLDGQDMSKGYVQGWTAVLKNLKEFLKDSLL